MERGREKWRQDEERGGKEDTQGGRARQEQKGEDSERER